MCDRCFQLSWCSLSGETAKLTSFWEEDELEDGDTDAVVSGMLACIMQPIDPQVAQSADFG
jgi:hypothetical protein